MDTLAPSSMKSAARSEMSCELQNQMNHEMLECILQFFDQKKDWHYLRVDKKNKNNQISI